MKYLPVRAARLGVAGIAVLGVLAACSGGGGSSPTSSPPVAVSPPDPPPPAVSTVKATRFSEGAVFRGLVHGFGFSVSGGKDVFNFAGGAASGDVDGDGDLDLLVLRGDLGPNLLYLNTGADSFDENAVAANVAFTKDGSTNNLQSGPLLADFDGDGDLDLFLGGIDGDPSQVLANDGSGIFTDVTASSGFVGMTSLNTVSAAAGDYDRDGDLDIALAHWGSAREAADPGETETLWRNDSDTNGIQFTPVSASSGVADGLALDLPGVMGRDHDYTFAPSFADIDADGHQDLLLVSDFGGSQVLLNNRDGTFLNITDAAIITDENGMGSAVGDYDGDGDFDWFVSSINGNRLYQNKGAGIFDNVTTAAGVGRGGWGWGSCFADFNGDGDLDIYQTNGWFTADDGTSDDFENDQTKLWIANGDGTFTDQAEAFEIDETEQGRGIVCDDFDKDGDVDVVLLTTDPDQSIYYWRNELADDLYLSVSLTGLPPNTHAIGARIEVDTRGETQSRLVGANSNFTSHNSTVQTFGLGDVDVVDTLRVTWPDGSVDMMSDVSVNQLIEMTQSQ